MTEQLALELEPPRPNPNAGMFHADGSPKRLLWCSDAVRMAWHAGDHDVVCPYDGRRNPCPPCCKELVS